MPTDAKSAAAATKPTTLLRIAFLSIIKRRVEHHRSRISFFLVQLCMSRNYNGYLPAVTSFITIFNFGSLTEAALRRPAVTDLAPIIGRGLAKSQSCRDAWLEPAGCS